jgi:hypothetical protein
MGSLHQFIPRDGVFDAEEPTNVPVCPQCKTPMWLVRIVDDLGRTLRTYDCPGCQYQISQRATA